MILPQIRRMRVNVFKVIFSIVLVMSFAITSLAQRIVQPKMTLFTSVYTILGSGCKVLRGTKGADNASICKGRAPYQVRVYSSAAATHIVAEVKGSDKTIPLTTVDIGFDERKTRLEWRLANGKPFAVIMRVPRYGPATDDHPYFGEAVGQDLIVVGLNGYETINSTVNAKTADANIKARSAADAAFRLLAKK